MKEAGGGMKGEERLFELLDPNPDILALFCHYNDLYFHNKLHTCTVGWSSSRMTLCAGICKYIKGSCEIRLSEPLLKFRSSADLKETLLHEMIHAYLWLTGSNKDHEDHGPCFQKVMQAINDSQALDHQRPEGGYHITIYHQFSDEVNSYRKHHWMCTRCGDLIKRAQNRAPSQADCFQKLGRGSACINEHCHWHYHQQHCGGNYEKIAEPEGYKDRRAKSCRYVQDGAAEDRAVEQEKYIFRKNKDALCNMRGDKIKSREGTASVRTQNGASLEKYFSTNSNGARERLVTATKFGEACVENSNKTEKVRKKAEKRSRDCERDETREDGFYLTFDGQQSDGAINLERIIVQKDKCTVIIGWKGWYAFESEEDEENTKALVDKRRQRRMLERGCCEVQNPCLPSSAVWGPVSSNREMVESGEVKHMQRQSVLEDVDFGSKPLDSSLQSLSVTCSSTMLKPKERPEKLSFSYAVGKNSPREPGTLTSICSSPGQPGTSTIAGGSSVLLSSCQETLASASAKLTSFIDAGDCTTEGFANIKESSTSSLDKDGHRVLVMEASRSGKALPLDEVGGEIGEGIGGKIKRKGRSKRLRKSEGGLIERGPSAACPICQRILSGDIEDEDFNGKFNQHIDACMGALGEG